ncbi:MAG: hypothetical protein H7222_04640 [Methylotenera sp.]|nr:hypothetical protein [Oligoflexia bacterium]
MEMQRLLSGAQNECSLSPKSVKSNITQNNKWNKTAVSVCFATTSKDLTDAAYKAPSTTSRFPAEISVKPFTELLRSSAKSAIMATYTSESTGIHFVGWKDCSPSGEPKADVVLFIGPETSPGIATAGTIGDPAKDVDRNPSGHRQTSICINPLLFQSTEFPAFERFSRALDAKLSAADYVKAAGGESFWQKALVHEFGHVAGLYHEHNRSEAESGSVNTAPLFESQRKSLIQGTRTESLAKVDQPVPTGAYDFQSAMSYEWRMTKEFAVRTKFFCQKLDQLSASEAMSNPLIRDTLRIYEISRKDPEAAKGSLNDLFCAGAPYEKLLLSSQMANRTLLSPGDREALASMYLARPVTGSWREEDAHLKEYLGRIAARNDDLRRVWLLDESNLDNH